MKHNLSGTRIYGIWYKIKSDCCPEWTDLNVFHEWLKFNGWIKGKMVYKHEDQLPYSPENSYVDYSSRGKILERDEGDKIREYANNGIDTESLAQDYRVSASTIRNIINKRYK